MVTALKAGTIDAIYTGESEARDIIAASSGYSYMHAQAGWSQGVAYGCRPQFGNLMTKLNTGLRAFKATSAYATLCAKYSSITCDCGASERSSGSGDGTGTPASPTAPPTPLPPGMTYSPTRASGAVPTPPTPPTPPTQDVSYANELRSSIGLMLLALFAAI